MCSLIVTRLASSSAIPHSHTFATAHCLSEKAFKLFDYSLFELFNIVAACTQLA